MDAGVLRCESLYIRRGFAFARAHDANTPDDKPKPLRASCPANAGRCGAPSLVAAALQRLAGSSVLRGRTRRVFALSSIRFIWQPQKFNRRPDAWVNREICRCVDNLVTVEPDATAISAVHLFSKNQYTTHANRLSLHIRRG